MVGSLRRVLEIGLMESSVRELWVIKLRDADVEFTLHESAADALKQCKILNSKFGDRFYVDTYTRSEEKLWKS